MKSAANWQYDPILGWHQHTESAATPELEAVLDEVRRLREAGDALAEAAHRISATYDGVHRLRLALAGWYTALANEWGRDAA